MSKRHYNVGEDNPMYGKKRPELAASMYGRKHSPETIEKMRLIKLGENNPFWTGDNIQYRGLHKWVRSHMTEPEFCQDCSLVPPFDLANVTGVYSRDFNNWKYLCRKCHMLSDGRMNNLKKRWEKRNV